MQIGYVRVSSYDQNSSRQLAGVKTDAVYIDRMSGKDLERPELARCLGVLQQGDTLHVHSIDRLTRNLQNLLTLLGELSQKGVTVQFHKEKLTFYGESSAFQKLHLHIIGAVAEFERAFIRERQREGIEIAKRAGKYKGRKAILSPHQVKEVAARILRKEKVTSLAREYGVSRQTLYRSLQGLTQEAQKL